MTHLKIGITNVLVISKDLQRNLVNQFLNDVFILVFADVDAERGQNQYIPLDALYNEI